MIISEGRHILHEMVAENYVQNDIVLGASKGDDQTTILENGGNETEKVVSGNTLSVRCNDTESRYAVARR